MQRYTVLISIVRLIGVLAITAMLLSVNAPATTATPASTGYTVYIPLTTRPGPPWLERLNAYRIQAGVPPVYEDPNLSVLCLYHAIYMAVNNDLTFDQDPTKPNSNPLGQQCVESIPGSTLRRGHIWRLQNGTAVETQPIDFWMSLPLARVRLLYPYLEKVGFGFVAGVESPLRNTAAIEVTTGINQTDETYGGFPFPVKYPVGGQVDVPATAYPITVFWKRSDPAPNITTIILKVNEVDKSFNQSPLPAPYTGVVITPTEPFPAGAKVQVTISGTHNGNPVNETWTFYTTAP